MRVAATAVSKCPFLSGVLLRRGHCACSPDASISYIIKADESADPCAPITGMLRKAVAKEVDECRVSDVSPLPGGFAKLMVDSSA
jgi:hypothetical protein